MAILPAGPGLSGMRSSSLYTCKVLLSLNLFTNCFHRTQYFKITFIHKTFIYLCSRVALNPVHLELKLSYLRLGEDFFSFPYHNLVISMIRIWCFSKDWAKRMTIIFLYGGIFVKMTWCVLTIVNGVCSLLSDVRLFEQRLSHNINSCLGITPHFSGGS